MSNLPRGNKNLSGVSTDSEPSRHLGRYNHQASQSHHQQLQQSQHSNTVSSTVHPNDYADQFTNRQHSNHQPLVPPGVLAIYAACSTIYENQPNPMQVSALRKYWLDGPDPLDYISMYQNPGDETRGIPPHWHYVSLGLSDLHGDGRVHERASPDDASGYGFELTFRLKRETSETAAPTWPAVLMQALARYVFQSDNILQGGDHVSWHSPLDSTESRVQHMLMAEDAQLSPIQSPFGYVNFIQIVGVCAEELKAAQHWNGPGVLELLRNISSAGGPWLITDMRRGETIFELDHSFQEKLEQGIEQEGSNLSGVSGFIHWDELSSGEDGQLYNDGSDKHINALQLSDTDTEKIKSMLQKGLRSSHHQPSQHEDSDLKVSSTGQHEKLSSRKDSVDSNQSGDQPAELVRTKTLQALHIKFNTETGSLLPLALRGRLKHGRHFTFKSTLNESAVTFVSPSVAGAIVDSEHRYATHGLWLQVLLDDEFINQLSHQLEFLNDITQVHKPEVFSWPEHNLTISILPDSMLNVGGGGGVTR